VCVFGQRKPNFQSCTKSMFDVETRRGNVISGKVPRSSLGMLPSLVFLCFLALLVALPIARARAGRVRNIFELALADAPVLIALLVFFVIVVFSHAPAIHQIRVVRSGFPGATVELCVISRRMNSEYSSAFAGWRRPRSGIVTLVRVGRDVRLYADAGGLIRLAEFSVDESLIVGYTRESYSTGSMPAIRLRVGGQSFSIAPWRRIGFFIYPTGGRRLEMLAQDLTSR
jgi:hypothetical protein